MILGIVSADGVPTIILSIAGQDWSAIKDPVTLERHLVALRKAGPDVKLLRQSHVAGGRH